MPSNPASPANGNSDLLRGILIVVVILAASFGAFVEVRSHGRSPVSDVLDRIVSFVSPPPPKPARKAPERASRGTMAPLASPSAGGGLADSGADGGQGSGGAGGGGSAGGAPATTAAQALRNVLKDFRADPQRTASITISSTGKVSPLAPGPLTHDGLPMGAVDGATLITGTAPASGTP